MITNHAHQKDGSLTPRWLLLRRQNFSEGVVDVRNPPPRWLAPFLLCILTALTFAATTIPSRIGFSINSGDDGHESLWRQFFPTEHNSEHIYHWSTSNFTLGLEQFVGQTVLLDLSMTSPRPPSVPAASASIQGGGWESGPFRIGGEWRHYRLLVPLTNDSHRITFHVTPFTPGSADLRRLGVALSELQITPVGTTAWAGPLYLLDREQLGFLALLPLSTYWASLLLLGSIRPRYGWKGMPHARLISFGLGAGTLIIVGSTAFYPMTMVTSVPNLWGLLPWAVLGGLPTLYRNYFRIRAYFICHPKVLITTVFAFSRAITYAIGVRYDGTSLDGFWQYISPSLLKTDFLRSLFYMHSQPPLFNLFLGLVVNLFPGSEVIVFHVVFIAISLVLALALNALMERLGMRRQMSLLLTILFVVSPTAILYENWLMYNYPVTSVLCVAAVFLHRFLSDWNLHDGLVFFGALAIACGTISTFHLLWLVMFVIMLLWTCRHAWKKVLIACSLPLLLVGALYGKNLVLYGSPTSSTWFGMSLWRVVANGLSTDEINAAITAGRLSPTARIMPFQQLSTYRGVVSSAPPTGIPILDAKNSYHHLAYVGISKQYLIDSITILRTNPTLYIPGIKQSWYFFFTPSSDQPWFYANTNRAKLGYLDRAYNLVLLGQMDYPTSPIVFNLPNEAFQGRLLMVWYGIALLYGLGVTAPTILLRFPRSRPFAITVAFLWLNVVYVSLVGTLFEVGENSRFRLMIDPFLLVLVGLAFTEVLRRIRRA